VQSMIGALATCCAWLEFDRGDHRKARAFDSDALCAAHLANNKDLQVEVLASMSMQAKRNDKPAEAINLAESALAIARGSDPRVRALISMRIALAAAKRKDAGAFRKARRRAWEQMERARQIDRPAWFRFFDERELSALEAIGLMDLGEDGEAARILAEVVGQQRTYVRNKAYYTAVRAQALLGVGAPEEAADVIRDALPVFTEVTSARIFDRLGQIHRGLQPYVSDPDVAECIDVLAGLVA
jgi:hypothetical protein